VRVTLGRVAHAVVVGGVVTWTARDGDAPQARAGVVAT